MNRLRKIFQWFWQTKERLVLGIMVAVLAFQIFNVLRTQEDESAGIPPSPRRAANPELLDPSPPGNPPDIPPKLPPIDPTRLSNNNPFDWREQTNSAAGNEANMSTLRLLRIQGSGSAVMVQIQTDSSRKWYHPGDAFESFELLSVDADNGTADVFDEGLNRTRTIELEK